VSERFAIFSGGKHLRSSGVNDFLVF